MRSIVVTGSLAFDQIMNMPGRFADHILPDKLHILNVSFLVDTLRRERGGTAGNIAYTLALLGNKPRVVAASGEDGKEYIDALEELGIDVSGVRVLGGETTALGTVMTDSDDNQIWAFYGGAMMRSGELELSVTKSDLVMIAPNDPKAVMKYVRECIDKRVGFVFDPAFQIPHYSKTDLKLAIENAEIVIGNDYEIELIRNVLGIKYYVLRDEQVLVTTLGKKGSMIRQGKMEYKIKAVKVENPVDPTGAGDAYRAGFLAGYVQGKDLQICGQMGSVAAAYTVEKYGTQTHQFTLKEFEMRYKDEF